MRTNTRHTLRLITLTAIALACIAAQGTAQTWTLGINWMTMNRLLDSGKTHQLFDSTIGCTLYHGPNFDTTAGSLNDSNVQGWAQHSRGKVLFSFMDKATYLYSGAERIQYDAVPNQILNGDSLRHFHFNGYSSVGHGDPSIAPTRWEIDSSASDHSDKLILYSNDFPTEWRAPAGLPFCVAVKLRVASIDRSSAADALTIHVTHYHAADGSQTTDTVHIPRSIFTRANTDTVVISASFTLGGTFIVGSDELRVEVHSTRHVTTRIAWVTVEDTLARDLLAYKDLDATDAHYTTWTNVHDRIRDSIAADTAAIVSAMGGSHIGYYALRDEPPVSEYTAMGAVNFLVNYRGTTEVENPENHARFVKLVQPRVLWSGGFSPGGQVCAYLDSSLVGNQSPPVKDSCGGSCYTVGTLRKYVSNSYGYFPFKKDHPHELVSDTAYATNTTYATADNGVYAGFSFDVYDVRRGAFPVTQLHNSWLHGVLAGSAVYFDSEHDSASAWWANIFAFAHLFAGYDTTRVYGGYYPGGPPPPQEELEATCGTALALGAKGLMFYTGVTIPGCDPGTDPEHSYAYCVGFTSDSGKWNSDSATYQWPQPTLFKRNTNWLIRYGRWFNTYASELNTMKWVGAFTRHGVEQPGEPDRIVRYSSSIGTNPLVVTDSDLVTRPMYAHWPTSGVPDTILHMPLPDSLRWITYGFYQNPADTLVKYLVAQNLFCDSRDLRAHWLWNADSACDRRGTRTLSCRLSLNPAACRYFRVSLLDSTSWDTIVAASNPRLTMKLGPGATKLFRIEPYPNVSIGKTSVDYANGRKCEFDGEFFHATYYRNDSIFYRRSITADPVTWGIEHYIGGSASMNAAHPSLRVCRSYVGIVYEVLAAGAYRVVLSYNDQHGEDTAWCA